MTNIGQVDDDLDQMLHRAAGLLDQLPDVPHDLVRLLHRIVAVDVRAILETLRTLAAQEDDTPSRDNGLTEIVVEVLLRIGVRRVEFSDPLMGHRCFLSRLMVLCRRLCVRVFRGQAARDSRRLTMCSARYPASCQTPQMKEEDRFDSHGNPRK